MDKYIIGQNAGVLWHFLNSNAQKKWNLSEIKDGTGFNDMQLASAIGWLAREDKIQFEIQQTKGKDNVVYVYLLQNVFF